MYINLIFIKLCLFKGKLKDVQNHFQKCAYNQFICKTHFETECQIRIIVMVLIEIFRRK